MGWLSINLKIKYFEIDKIYSYFRMVYSFPINLDKNDIVRKDKDFNTLT